MGWLQDRCGLPSVPHLTRCDATGDCARVAGWHHMDIPADMPIPNIRATKKRMLDHNDVWNPTRHSHLVQLLVSIAQGGIPEAAQVSVAASDKP